MSSRYEKRKRIEQAIELRKSGRSWRDIASILGYASASSAASTVRKYIICNDTDDKHLIRCYTRTADLFVTNTARILSDDVINAMKRKALAGCTVTIIAAFANVTVETVKHHCSEELKQAKNAGRYGDYVLPVSRIEIEKAKELVEQGYSLSDIANKLRRSCSTLSKHGIKSRHRFDSYSKSAA